MTGLNLFDTMSDVLDQAQQGIELGARYVRTTTDYAFEQMLMVDWALDWNASDRDLGLIEERYASDSNGGTGFAMGASIKYGNKPYRVPSFAGFNWRHVGTRYGPWGKKFQALYSKYGLDVNDFENLVPMLKTKHRNKHTPEYHQAVYTDLNRTLNKCPDDITVRRNALIERLEWWKLKLYEDPEILRRK